MGADERSWGVRQGAAALLVFSIVGFVAAAMIEAANGWRTENGWLGSPSAVAALLMLMAVPVAGFVAVFRRPAERPGWLMLWAGAVFGLGSAAHGIAIYSLITVPGWTAVGRLSAWLATWMLALGIGLLPFVLADWPSGRNDVTWLRRSRRLAAVALAMVVVSQALSDDRLDGVAHRAGMISNPLGIDGFTPIASGMTGGGAVVLVVFTVACMGDLLGRYWRGNAETRSRLRPALIGVVSVPAVAVVALLVGVAFDRDKTAAAVGAAQLAAIGGIVGVSSVAARSARRRDTVERERRRLIEQMESERRRVRHELHDGVGPILAALGLNLDLALSGLAVKDAHAADLVVRSKRLLADALAEIRRVVSDLRPAALDELGLAGAIRQQALRLTAEPADGATPMTLDVSIPAVMPRLSAALEVALLRIAGEALTNVVRHAGASHCTVKMEVRDAVLLQISDDGCGLEPGNSSGVGLASMRRRAEELGGSFAAEGRFPRGTVVLVSIPRST